MRIVREGNPEEGHNTIRRYRGTSLIKTRLPVGPCRRLEPVVLQRSEGGGVFF